MTNVGILLDDRRQERWVLESLQHAAAVPGVELGPVVVAPRRGGAPNVLHGAVDALDHCLRTRREPRFERVDVPEALRMAPRCQALPRRPFSSDWLFDRYAARRLAAIDVSAWLCAGRRPPAIPRDELAVPVYGLEVGDGVAAADSRAGSAEIVARSPATAVSVVDYRAGREPVLESVGSTVTNSARLNRLNALNKGVHLWARVLAGRRGAPYRVAPPRRPHRLPFMLAARLVGQVVANQRRRLTRNLQWQIGYAFGDQRRPPAALPGPRYLVPPSDRFWADPMPLVQDGRYFIFFEELKFEDWKGRLKVIEVFEDRPPGRPRAVLEKPWHLSYPFVFRHDGELYLLPESAGNGRLELYRCARFPDRWLFDRVLLDDVAAYDATLWQRGGRWWMFVSVAPAGATDGDELHVYHAPAPTGPWRPHAQNPVKSDARSARPAGPLYEEDGALFRPAQDCAARYGHAVVIHRIETLTPKAYRETPVRRIDSGVRDDAVCLHTLAKAGRLQVFDCQVPRRRPR